MGLRRSLTLADTEGMMEGHSIPVLETGEWESPSDNPFPISTVDEFTAHGLNLRLFIPEDAPPGGVSIDSIQGCVSAEMMEMRIHHPDGKTILSVVSKTLARLNLVLSFLDTL